MKIDCTAEEFTNAIKTHSKWIAEQTLAERITFNGEIIYKDKK